MAEPTRNSQSRAAMARPAIGGDERSLLNIDLTGLPSDMEATWVREQTMGEYDHQNIRTALNRNGYTPVTTDMLPQAHAITLPGAPKDENNLIREGGLILMMRPKTTASAAREAQRQEDEAAKNAATRIPEMSTDAGKSSIDGDNFVEHRQITERVASGAAPEKFKD